MKLAVDIGNSNIVIGFRDEATFVKKLRLLTKPDLEGPSYYTHTILNYLLEESINKEEIKEIGISSVVPELNTTITTVLTQIFQITPILIQPQHLVEYPMQIDKPYEIGSDLVANAVAAIEIYKSNCLIVDFGTALTFTVVSTSKGIIGVSIAPGLKTAIGALVGNTAQLPTVDLTCPDSVIGKNTEHAIQAGVLWGYVSLIEGMIQRIKAEYPEPLTVVATGGLSSVLDPLQPHFDHINKMLTLEGILFLTDNIRH